MVAFYKNEYFNYKRAEIAILMEVNDYPILSNAYPEPSLIVEMIPLLKNLKLPPYNNSSYVINVNSAKVILDSEGHLSGKWCKGNVDKNNILINSVYNNAVGWAWDSELNMVPDLIIFANSDNKYSGFAGFILDRNDVKNSIPGVNIDRVGWFGYFKLQGANLNVYAYSKYHESLCKI